MKCVQSLGNGSEPRLAKEVVVQHCSVRWSVLIEHASNQLLQMLLLISHNANLHVACGYIGCWACWINHHVCCMDTHMCVYGFVSDTSVYACMHGCQEWGAEFSLHVKWSKLCAVYLCLYMAVALAECAFFKCEGWHIDWSRLCECKSCKKFTHPHTCMHLSVYVYVAGNVGSCSGSMKVMHCCLVANKIYNHQCN